MLPGAGSCAAGQRRGGAVSGLVGCLVFGVALVGGALTVLRSFRPVVGCGLAVLERGLTLTSVAAFVGEPAPVLLGLAPIAFGLFAILLGSRAVMGGGSALDLTVHEDVEVRCHVAMISVCIAAVGDGVTYISFRDDAFSIAVAVTVGRVARCRHPVASVSDFVTPQGSRVVVICLCDILGHESPLCPKPVTPGSDPSAAGAPTPADFRMLWAPEQCWPAGFVGPSRRSAAWPRHRAVRQRSAVLSTVAKLRREDFGCESFKDPVILTDETGMRSRKVIGQAIGIIMERYGLDEDRAFGFLRRVSRQTNVKLRFVAADVVGQLNRQRVDGAGN